MPDKHHPNTSLQLILYQASEHAKKRAAHIGVMSWTLVLLGFYLTRQSYFLGQLIIHADESCSMI